MKTDCADFAAHGGGAAAEPSFPDEEHGRGAAYRKEPGGGIDRLSEVCRTREGELSEVSCASVECVAGDAQACIKQRERCSSSRGVGDRTEH